MVFSSPLDKDQILYTGKTEFSVKNGKRSVRSAKSVYEESLDPDFENTMQAAASDRLINETYVL
jgi:hypothetical protein